MRVPVFPRGKLAGCVELVANLTGARACLRLDLRSQRRLPFAQPCTGGLARAALSSHPNELDSSRDSSDRSAEDERAVRPVGARSKPRVAHEIRMWPCCAPAPRALLPCCHISIRRPAVLTFGVTQRRSQGSTRNQPEGAFVNCIGISRPSRPFAVAVAELELTSRSASVGSNRNMDSGSTESSSTMSSW